MNLDSLVQALKDSFSDTQRIRISEQGIEEQCRKLSTLISKEYTPDLIIAIDTGGSVPGDLVARFLSTPVEHVVIRRDIIIGRMYNNDPLPLRWMMSAYHHYLFHTTKPTLEKGCDSEIRGKKILIVDDSIHTGATLDVATEYFIKNGVKEFKIASLSYVSKRRPDFFVLPSADYCFPWSKDY